ncbi:MAG: NUMOD4 motif-containing HNH endonuclease [Candidatus Thorarchaeota archaeon]
MWKKIPQHSNYQVSNFGRVRSKRKVLKPRVLYPQGYLKVALSEDGFVSDCYIHHLVLEAFVGARPFGTETSHLDGDPTNNHISNLVWECHEDNELRKHQHGTYSLPPGAKLTPTVVCNMRRLYSHGWSYQRLATKYGVHWKSVSRAVRGKTWKCIL